MATALTPESVQLLQLIFGAEWEEAWVCWKSSMKGCRVRDLPASLPDEDTYFVIATIKAGASTRSGENAVRVKALVLDDIGTKLDATGWDMLVPEPNWVVESSPGNFQWGYLLDMEPSDYDGFRLDMKGSPLWGHSDGQDAVHLFRLPQGKHTKDPANTFDVRLVSISGAGHQDLNGFRCSEGSSTAMQGGVPWTLGLGALQELVDLIPHPPETTRAVWIQVIYGIAGAGGTFDIWDSYSRRWDQYNAADTQRTWDTLKWEGIHSKGGNLRKMAEEADRDAFNKWRNKWEPSVVFDDGEALPVEDDDTDEVEALQRDVTNLIVKQYGDRIRFNVSTGLWHKFDGTWKESPYPLGFRLAKRWADANAPMLGKAARAMVSKVSFYEGVEKMLRAEPSIAVIKTDFDQDDWLLGTPGGTVDLKTGVLRASLASEMISLSTSVAPSEKEDCPKWLAFVAWACTDPATKKVDLGLLKTLRQWLGYCLCGDVSKEAVLFIHGVGKNGKGTVIETVQWVLGDYFYMATKDLFMETKYGSHTEETAALAGKRMVAADEVPTAARWNESLLKACSGGGTMSSRHLYSRVFTFPIRFKVTIIGNAKPAFQGEINDALKRRLHLAGFLNTANPVDDTLKRALRAESAGILRWMIGGLVEMLSEGKLHIADSVITATEDYFNENDLFGEWLAETVEPSSGTDAPSGKLFTAWREWRTSRGHYGLVDNAKAFKEEMTKRGHVWIETNKGSFYKNLQVKSPF